MSDDTKPAPMIASVSDGLVFSLSPKMSALVGELLAHAYVSAALWLASADPDRGSIAYAFASQAQQQAVTATAAQIIALALREGSHERLEPARPVSPHPNGSGRFVTPHQKHQILSRMLLDLRRLQREAQTYAKPTP